MKFIADAMLGTLARWMRILGYDTLYARDISDDEIIELARKEGRIIISRDQALCKKIEGSILMNGTQLTLQIHQVMNQYFPDKMSILTRCIECNSMLESMGKSQAAGKVPPTVFEIRDEFWQCPDCRRIYWKGTHYHNMLAEAEKLFCEFVNNPQRDS